MKKTLPMLAALAACFLAGCAQPHGYVDPTTINFDRPENATLYDMKTCVANLVDKMKVSKRFQKHYNQLASEKEPDLPVLQIGNIANISTNRVQQKLESVRRRLEMALGETELFEIVDDAASAESIQEELDESMRTNANAGRKDEEAQWFGEYANADYMMLGRYRKFHDGNRYSYELSLQLIDLRTRKQVWSGIADFEKE